MDSSRFDKPYDPKPIEDRLYSDWERSGQFRPRSGTLEAGAAPVFSMVIPPPNITGSLHIGHALNNTLQDILARWNRMRGAITLWVPGTDHAGIATQNVVERQLKSEGLDRERIGREEFIRRVWSWREQSGRTIIHQLKRLGASCDWTRERFTLDAGLSVAVREVFVRLYGEDLIYRGQRLINWCPRCTTALSDIEVEHEETAGKMYYICYPVEGPAGAAAAGEPEALTVATTRPETLLGDTAVAVHPDDPRFRHLIGRRVRLPLTQRSIPIVADALLVDREFGTGAVKITPGHDFNDEKAGQRHGLTSISLLDENGRFDPATLSLEAKADEMIRSQLNLKRVPEARQMVVEALESRGALLRVEDHRLALGRCYRCKTVVEPFNSPQWFVRVDDPDNSLARPAIEAVRSGRIRLIPEGWRNNYFGWMEGIQDWCISRQIWWGHQIPVWYCLECDPGVIQPGAVGVGAIAEGANVPGATESVLPVITAAARPIVQREAPTACPHCGSTQLLQDPDVLDTWFSSALWPFSTLGWPPEQATSPDDRRRTEQELRLFYPTSTLVTSFDILFFWVARMIMMGLKFMGDVPFRDVYLHPLVRDAEGQKMSKSKGNVIDPLEVMARYGTDALRFTLASMASGRDIRLTEERIAGYRNFANKIWNAARFIHMQGGAAAPLTAAGTTLADRWISARLAELRAQVQRALTDYRFDEACRLLYQFTWHEFCDWYLELSKPILADADHPARAGTVATLVSTFDAVLRMLHPFMPFITEEIWQTLPRPAGGPASIMIAPYPSAAEADRVDLEARDLIGDVIDIVSRVRAARAELGLPPTLPLAIVVQAQAPSQVAALGAAEPRQQVMRLARLRECVISDSASRPRGSYLVPSERVRALWIQLGGVIDPAKERARLQAELGRISAEADRINQRLADPNFAQRAPEDVRLRDQARSTELADRTRRIHEHLSGLEELGG